jgi:transposase-like protein
MKNDKEKAAIVASYLRGGVSYRELGYKHGVSLGALHKWIQEHEQKMKKNALKAKVAAEVEKMGPMPTDMELLQAELHKTRMHNKLLEEIIRIAEEELKTPITKKYGTRQS